MAHRRSGRKIDFVHWTGFSAQSSAQASGSTVGVTLFAAQHEPETMLRMRGQAFAFADGTGAPSRMSALCMGIILVPEGTGTTVLWSPAADSDAPWIWTWDAVIANEELVVDVIAVQEMLGQRTVINSKAMRILRNQEVQVVFETTTLTSAISINSGLLGRLLAGQ